MGTAGGGVSKQALSRVPGPAKGPMIWLAAIWASYCGSLHGFNTSNIAGVMGMPTFVKEFAWNEPSSGTISNYKGWVTSSMLLGQTVGILLASPIMESRGRKIIILVAALTYTIGSLLMAVNFGSLPELLVGRIISGLGSGLAYSAGPCYLSEIAPAELRGMLSTFYNAGIMSSVAGAYWINYGCSQVLSDRWQWVTPMILQMILSAGAGGRPPKLRSSLFAVTQNHETSRFLQMHRSIGSSAGSQIPSGVLLLGYPFIPESPRFLLMAGQVDEAKRSLSRLRGGLDETYEYFAREWTELSQGIECQSDEGAWKASTIVLRRVWNERQVRKILIFVFTIQTFFIMSGGNSITYYAPNILKSVGFNSEKVLLFTAVYGLIKFISVLVYAMFLTERFGRRPLLLIGATVNFICLIYLSAYLGKANVVQNSENASPAAIVAVISICVFAVGYGVGWGPSFSVAASEICPTSIRGPVVTIGFVYQNLLNFGITRGFPNMTQDMHAYGPFALFATFTFCGIFWVFFAFPECRGRSMESTESLFLLPWYKIGFTPVPDQFPNTPVDEEKSEDSEHKEHIG